MIEESPTTYNIISWVLSLIIGSWAWILKMTVNRHLTRVDDMEKTLQDHKLYVSDVYAKKTDVHESIQVAIQPLVESQRRIETQLDRLVEWERDKHHGDE